MSRLGRAQRFKPLTLAIRLVIPGIFPTGIDLPGTIPAEVPFEIIQALGTPALDLDFTLTSIPSEEAFGTPFVGVGQIVSPPTIDSAEAFGTPDVGLDVAPTGIASA